MEENQDKNVSSILDDGEIEEQCEDSSLERIEDEDRSEEGRDGSPGNAADSQHR